MSVYIKRSAFYITYILIFLQVLCSKFKELFRKKKKEHHLKRLNNKKGFDSSIVYCSVFFYLSNKSFMFGCCFNFCFIFFKYNYLGFPTLPQVFNFSVLLRQKKNWELIFIWFHIISFFHELGTGARFSSVVLLPLCSGKIHSFLNTTVVALIFVKSCTGVLFINLVCMAYPKVDETICFVYSFPNNFI